MSFFKRKDKNLVPPVAEPISSRNEKSRGSNSTSPMPAYRSSNAATYVTSRDGPSPNPSSSPAPPNGGWSRSHGIGDVYTRGQADIDNDRGELFSGYKPEDGKGRFFTEAPGSGALDDSANPGEENEEDVEGIKQQLRATKQESVNSTRNALRLAREAEETARNTVTRLGDQSGTYNL